MKLSLPVIFFICLGSNIPFVASSFYKVQIIPEENIIRQQTKENTATSLSVGATELQGEKISSQHLYLCWEFWGVWNSNCIFHVKKKFWNIFICPNKLSHTKDPAPGGPHRSSVACDPYFTDDVKQQITSPHFRVFSCYSMSSLWEGFPFFYISIFDHGRWINID